MGIKKGHRATIQAVKSTHHVYADIITETLLPFAYYNYGRDFVIHQDNSPIHTSKFCTSIADIQQCVVDYHTSLSAEKCSSYIDHMRIVMQAVIEKNGGWSNM